MSATFLIFVFGPCAVPLVGMAYTTYTPHQTGVFSF